jgi:membrane protein involved in colicin uptake
LALAPIRKKARWYLISCSVIQRYHRKKTASPPIEEDEAVPQWRVHC